MGFLMPNNNRYEISEALQMPLPLTKEEAMQETLTQEETAETIVPDYCPDIARIISAEGVVCPHGGTEQDGVTGTVRVSGGALPVVSVRTAGEVPKEKVLDVARALCRVHLTAPVQAGDVVIPNVLGTGVDVVATRSV